ncbi:MAG: helicase-associated domain-containing protein [Brevinematales bacterium]|nr:helicase-associated domain-containing protein [Brevinematales bacterium]
MMRSISRTFALKWFEKEPELIATLYREVTGEDVSPSFDTPTNQQRLATIQAWWNEHLPELLENLSDKERLVLDIIIKNFGWLVYDSLENLLRFLSSVFSIEKQELQQGLESLCSKRFIYSYEPLTHYSFLFLSPFIPLQTLQEPLDPNLAHHLYELLPPIIGLLAYLIAHTPRSSEANEIHRIDFQKLQCFFEHSPASPHIETYLKNLAHIGLIQKYNNRIVIQKNIVDQIRKLPLSSLFSLSFFYETLEKLEFQKSAFLTLQWLAYSRHEALPLREVFFYYCQHVLTTLPRQSLKSMKLFLQKEEQNFLLFIKQLEKHHILTILRNNPLQISRQDSLTLHPFYRALLRHEDISSFFRNESFIVEANGEVIVEPDLNPSIHLELIFIAEPKEIHPLSIYQITKKSIYKALAYGYTIESIVAFLEKHSRHPLSFQLIQNIKHYGEHYTHPTPDSYHILQFPSHISSLIADHFSQESIEIEPHTFIFFDEKSYEEVKSFCNKEGLSFKENINFLHQTIVPYSSSLEHHIKHLKRFLDNLESESMFLPRQDILKVRLLSKKDFELLSPEKTPEH